MAKNTVKNTVGSPLALFISAGLTSQESKAKSELTGSKAYAFALLASHDADTLAKFQRFVSNWNEADEKVKEQIRTEFADFIDAGHLIERDGDKERKTADYRNYINAQFKRVQFAVDVHALNWSEFVIIDQKGNGFIKGNSSLSSAIWTAMDWNNKKAIAESKNQLADIALVQRASLSKPGDVSWAKLADLVNAKAGRKDARVTANTPKSVSAKQPVTALKVVGEIASNAEAAHFSAVESRMIALETGEDILALVVEGDDWADERKALDAVVERIRAKLNEKIAAKNKIAAMNKAAVA